MDRDGDPHPHTPGDPRGALHRYTLERQYAREEEKKARIQELKKLRRERVALELEQGPSELQMEDPGTPQVRRISPPAALATGSLETPAPDTKHIEEQAEKTKKARSQGALALDLKEFGSEHHRFSQGFIRQRQELLEAEARSLCSSSPRVTGSPAPEGARVRQSILYSGRPRRSKRSTTGKIQVEEHVGEVSSREFEALTLDQSPPTPDSTHRPAGTTIRVRQSALYSSRLRQSRGRQEQEPSQNKPLVEENAGKVSASEGPTVTDRPEFKVLALNEASPKPELTDRSKKHDTANSDTESEVVEEEPKDESDIDSEEEWRKLKEYKETMIHKVYVRQSAKQTASCDKNSAVEHVTECSEIAEWAKRSYLTWRKSLLVCSEAQHTMVASSEDEPRCEVSDEDIIQNGKKWMSEEVMVAFKEYIEGNDKLRELKYRFEELCHQCFNVECYFKIFHHYNFTVKTKLPSSDDWKLGTYFAEVKEIFGKKHYFCRPLESNENGRCYACSNQEVNDLRHPATGGFERGLPDTVFPYM